jgi:hypothetical protein
VTATTTVVRVVVSLICVNSCQSEVVSYVGHDVVAIVVDAVAGVGCGVGGYHVVVGNGVGYSVVVGVGCGVGGYQVVVGNGVG